MKDTDEPMVLEDMNKINDSVHKYIREHDAKKTEQEYCDDKFGEFSRYVDLDARRSFKYPTTSMLKYSYSFNHHAVPNLAINKYGSNKCSQCGAIEDWEHVLKCPCY